MEDLIPRRTSSGSLCLTLGGPWMPIGSAVTLSRERARDLPTDAARRRRPVGLCLDESAPDRVTRELDAIAHAELFEDVGAVALDGFDADDEDLGDLLGAVRLGDQLQHFELPRRQDLARLFAVACLLEVVADQGGDG